MTGPGGDIGTGRTTEERSTGARDPSPGRPPSMRSSREAHRRWLAAGLIAYGVVGLFAFAMSIPLVVGPLASFGEGGEAIRWLDLASRGLEDAGRGTVNANASLRSAATAARDGASLAQELSASMASLREASHLSILGSQPLAGLADGFDRVAGRAGGLSSSMTSLAGSLDRDAGDFATLSADATALRTQLDSLRSALASGEAPGVGASAGWFAPTGLLIGAWLAMPALVSLVTGTWLLRTAVKDPLA